MERDFVPDLESFRSWCRQMGIAVRADADDLGIDEVHRLRDAIVAVTHAAASGAPPPAPALAELNRHVPAARLTWSDGGFTLDPGAPPGSLRQALAALARDSVDLLTGERRGQLKLCDREGHCDWLFLDTTRNHSRRYCTDGCATIERVHRHIRRKGKG